MAEKVPSLESMTGTRILPEEDIKSIEEQLEYTRQRAANFERVVRNYQNELGAVPRGIRRGLGFVGFMFAVQYVVGLGLILTTAWMVLARRGSSEDLNLFAGVVALLFGAGGIGTLLYTTHKASPFFLQRNRVDLAQLNMASFTWLHVVMGLSEYLSTRNKVLLRNGNVAQALDWTTHKECFDQMMDRTEQAMRMIEENCQLDGRVGSVTAVAARRSQRDSESQAIDDSTGAKTYSAGNTDKLPEGERMSAAKPG